MTAMRHWLGRGHREGGAAAVEFALVMPILFLLLFGIIDYGLLFFDSIGLRQGAREGARQAVVQKTSGGCTASPYTATSMKCAVTKATDLTLATNVAVKITPVDSAGAETPTWSQGSQLKVCVQAKEQSLTGYVPFPAGGIMKTKTLMSIEEATTPPTVTQIADTAPAGSDWSWC